MHFEFFCIIYTVAFVVVNTIILQKIINLFCIGYLMKRVKIKTSS